MFGFYTVCWTKKDKTVIGIFVSEIVWTTIDQWRATSIASSIIQKMLVLVLSNIFVIIIYSIKQADLELE